MLQFLPSARRVIAVFLCIVFASAALADEHHPLWVVKGKHNSVYFLGSIHLLRDGESLPPVIDEAYQDSKKLVMEIDLDDLDPMQAQQLTMQLGLLPAGETLMKQIGADATAKLNAFAAKNSVPIAMLSQFKPWFAAVTLTQLALMKSGLNSQSGVEQQFVAKAAADHKEIVGLETLEQQLHLLADLPPRLQTDFLLQSLDEADQAQTEINDMLVAWRSGDSVALEKIAERGMKDYPEIYRPLTVERNRHWLSRLDSMLASDDNYLVIVGVLHLVGKDGVLDLLEKKGYKIEQR